MLFSTASVCHPDRHKPFLATIKNLHAERDVRWAEIVQLLDTIQDGVLTVSSTSS